LRDVARSEGSAAGRLPRGSYGLWRTYERLDGVTRCRGRDPMSGVRRRSVDPVDLCLRRLPTSRWRRAGHAAPDCQMLGVRRAGLRQDRRPKVDSRTLPRGLSVSPSASRVQQARCRVGPGGPFDLTLALQIGKLRGLPARGCSRRPRCQGFHRGLGAP